MNRTRFLVTIALLPVIVLPIAPAVWLLMVAIKVAPMTWAGFFFNWLVVSVILEAWFIYSRVRDVFRQAWTLTVHDALTRQLSELKAKGLDDVQAGAALVVGAWQLPVSEETLTRAALVSNGVGQLVIGLLMFSKKIGVDGAIKQALVTDRFYRLHGCLYFTAVPLTDFARKHMNRIWNLESVSKGDVSDAALAAYYATLIVPFAVDAWMILAELKQRGFCLEIDNRDHVRDGLNCTRAFLETARNIEPEFQGLLTQGIKHLSEMGKMRPEEILPR